MSPVSVKSSHQDLASQQKSVSAVRRMDPAATSDFLWACFAMETPSSWKNKSTNRVFQTRTWCLQDGPTNPAALVSGVLGISVRSLKRKVKTAPPTSTTLNLTAAFRKHFNFCIIAVSILFFSVNVLNSFLNVIFKYFCFAPLKFFSLFFLLHIFSYMDFYDFYFCSI